MEQLKPETSTSAVEQSGLVRLRSFAERTELGIDADVPVWFDSDSQALDSILIDSWFNSQLD